MSVEHLVLLGAGARPTATRHSLHQPVPRGLRNPAQPESSHVLTAKAARFFEYSLGIEQRSQCYQAELLIAFQNIVLESRMRLLRAGRRGVCGARLTQIYLTMSQPNIGLASSPDAAAAPQTAGFRCHTHVHLPPRAAAQQGQRAGRRGAHVPRNARRAVAALRGACSGPKVVPKATQKCTGR